MLPCEIFEGFDSEGFHLIQLHLAQAPPNRFELFSVEFGEVNVEKGCFDVELNPKRPIAEQKVKSRLVCEVSREAQASHRSRRQGNQNDLEQPGNRQVGPGFRGRSQLNESGSTG